MAQKLNKNRILGVLAGADFPPERLSKWVLSADYVFAADSAADALNQLGLVPGTTVGDLDSISATGRACQLELLEIHDQDSTDCDKLLSLALERGFSKISLIGVEGDLLDHVIGTLLSAARASIDVTLILRRGFAQILTGPTHVRLTLPKSTRLSVMPLTPCFHVTMNGTEWPLSDSTLDPMGLTSLSNRGSGPVQIQIGSGVAILFLAHPDLENVDWEIARIEHISET